MARGDHTHGGGKLMVVAGTRPEAIKLAPLIVELRRRGLPVTVCATGQHRELFDQAMAYFNLEPDIDLALMRPGQSVDGFMARALAALGPLLRAEQPDMVVVQGDTATAYAAALAAFYAQIPVAHVEAGLRSGDITDPFPEEFHRRQISQIADQHFAPTASAQAALLAEGVAPERIYLTGNTGIDALHQMTARLASDPRLAEPVASRLAAFGGGRKLMLATIHRRENHGAVLNAMIDAVIRLARFGDLDILIPVHPHPLVHDRLRQSLGGVANVHLLAPLSYPELIHLLQQARLVLTDSGGIQEEAPALGCPALVLRRTTERPEGLGTGNARLVRADPDVIVEEVRRIVDRNDSHAAMASVVSPYGDGRATQRIANILESHLGWPGSLSNELKPQAEAVPV